MSAPVISVFETRSIPDDEESRIVIFHPEDRRLVLCVNKLWSWPKTVEQYEKFLRMVEDCPFPKEGNEYEFFYPV